MNRQQKKRQMVNAFRAMNDIIFRRTNLSARPLEVHLEVNDYCNLKCFMCPREIEDLPINTGNMSMDVVRALGPMMEHAMHVGLVGNGEPFMHPQLFDIIDFVASKGTAPSVITNGTLLEKHIDNLVKVGPMMLNFSIDGGTKETFEKIRLRADFDVIVNNLYALNERKKEVGTIFPIVNFIVCFMNENMHELNEIVDIAIKGGVSTIVVQKLFPYHPDVQSSIITDNTKAREYVETARAKASANGIEIRFHEMGDSVDVRVSGHDENETGNGQNSNKIKDRKFYCDYAWRKMHVALNGETRVCCFWTQGSAGNVTEEDPQRLWNNEIIVGAREQILHGDLPKDCSTCHMICPHRRKPLASEAAQKIKEVWRQ